jgi:hypothetical protein
MARPDGEGSGRVKKTSGAKPKNQKALVQHTVGDGYDDLNHADQLQ